MTDRRSTAELQPHDYWWDDAGNVGCHKCPLWLLQGEYDYAEDGHGNAIITPRCTCKWSPVVGRLLCPACIEKHLARNADRKADY